MVDSVRRAKSSRVLTILCICIAMGSLVAAVAGVVIPDGQDVPFGREVVSIHGEVVRLDGRGLYRNDSVSCAAQARGQDYVTIFVGVPLLLFGTLYALKGSLRGRLIQAGSLGYVLYTFSSYAYLCNYNELFLLYVALFGTSLFAFILSFRSFGPTEVQNHLSPRFPRRFLGGYLLAMGSLLALMWLARIIPALLAGVPPMGLEHYTTFVIQVNDLGIVVPAAVVTGILILKRRPMGATLSAILFMKLLTMALALFAMMAMMFLSGVALAPAEVFIFTAMLVSGLIASVLMILSVKD